MKSIGPQTLYENKERDVLFKNNLLDVYPQKLELTSPTSGGRSVGIVRSRTQATENFY
jgi:hypothetical protein